MSESDDEAKKRERKQGLAAILANAARTTGRAGSTTPGQTLVELRCKSCGAPREGEKTFVCAYCGSRLA